MYGYTIEDIDKALSDYLKSQQIVLPMDGKNIRLRVTQSAPEDIYGAKTIPCLNIESGFKMDTPYSWLKSAEKSVEMKDFTNIEVTRELHTVYYSYKIGYYVKEARHDIAMTQLFMRIFPSKMMFSFDKALEDGSKENYRLLFMKEPRTIKMDTYVDGMKIYRKDIILTTTLHFESSYSEEFMRMKGFSLELLKGE
jgi:hypothetical protein